MTYFPRKILKDINRWLDDKSAIVITGTRRTGKTTLLQMIYDQIENENKAFYDLENPLHRQYFSEINYDNILANLKQTGITSDKKSFIFLDEIQAMPEITKMVKYLYDHYDIKFFLTGSSSFYLKNLFPESLAGRKIIFELFPLDFEEFLIFKGYDKKKFTEDFIKKDQEKNFIAYELEKKYFDEYLEFGGFPQIVLEENYQKKRDQLEDVYKSYFEKEVSGLADFHDLGSFQNLLRLLVQRAGSKLDISKLATEIGLTRKTIYGYLYFLEKTYFLNFVPLFSSSIDREVSGAKKIYICDNGILNLLSPTPAGVQLENIVFQNLKKYGEIRYYQKRNGQEIDFILPEKSTALEVKLAGDDRDYHKLIKIATKLNLKNYFVITKSFVKKDGFIPAQDL